MATAPPVFRPSAAPDHATSSRRYDQARYKLNPYRAWYNLKAWKRIAADQLAEEPLCRFCLAAGHTTAATTCDHITPHRGDPDLFWTGPFQSLCTTCHSRAKQYEESLGLNTSKVGGVSKR